MKDEIVKNKGGRPLKFKTVEELEEKINEYFTNCWTQKIDMFGNPIFIKDAKGKKTDKPVMIQNVPYTMSGLAVALDTDRATLIRYKAKDRFYNTIKRAKQMCQSYAESSLFIGKNPTGAIFNLKNNYEDWKDKTESEVNLKGRIIVGFNYLPPKRLETNGRVDTNNQTD